MTLHTFALQVLQYKAFFRMGVARPLSPLYHLLEIDRYLTARYTGENQGSLLGYSARDWHRLHIELKYSP